MRIRILLTVLCFTFVFSLASHYGLTSEDKNPTIAFMGTTTLQSGSLPIKQVSSKISYTWADSFLSCQGSELILFRFNELGYIEYSSELILNSPFDCFGNLKQDSFQMKDIIVGTIFLSVLVFLVSLISLK